LRSSTKWPSRRTRHNAGRERPRSFQSGKRDERVADKPGAWSDRETCYELERPSANNRSAQKVSQRTRRRHDRGGDDLAAPAVHLHRNH
jgi:hypothetical protein